MEKFTVAEVQNFMRIIFCMSYDRFKAMYKHVMGSADDGYVTEKFEKANRNTGAWMCDIDAGSLEKMFDYCFNIEKRG